MEQEKDVKRTINLDENLTGDEYTPYIRANENLPELTPKAIILGIIIGMLFGAANVYVGLKVGMTIGASIPAAVISMAILRGLFKKGTILENNIVQTIGSAAESLAAGVIFTVPAFFILEMSEYADKWLIMLYCLLGGILGTCLMIPLRRYLARKQHNKLPYPEGTACAEVLSAGQEGGVKAKFVFIGLTVGAVFKFIEGGLRIFKGEVEIAIDKAKRFFIGGDIIPVLLSVGYLVGPRIAAVMLAGGALAWLVMIPLIMFIGDLSPAPIYPSVVPINQMGVWDIWNYYVRYIGAGAVAVGGIISLIKSIPVIIGSFSKGIKHFGGKNVEVEGTDTERTDKDLPFKVVLITAITIMLFLALVPQIPIGFLGSFLVVLFSFFFVTVTSRVVGLVGSSSNPVSGMTLTSLVGISFILLWWYGDGPKESMAAQVAALSCGVMVCIAVCLAGDTSQDLKTGFLVGATPKKQQIGEFIGVISGAAIVVLTVFLLAKTYGISGDPAVEQLADQSRVLKAPQANLMAMVIKGVFGGTVPWTFVMVGCAIGLIVAMLNIPVLPFAVGVYLPIHLSTPIMAGGLVHWLVKKTSKDKKVYKKRNERGVLYCSGLIAGEAMIGIILALFILIPKGSETKVIKKVKVTESKEIAYNYETVSNKTLELVDKVDENGKVELDNAGKPVQVEKVVNSKVKSSTLKPVEKDTAQSTSRPLRKIDEKFHEEIVPNTMYDTMEVKIYDDPEKDNHFKEILSLFAFGVLVLSLIYVVYKKGDDDDNDDDTDTSKNEQENSEE